VVRSKSFLRACLDDVAFYVFFAVKAREMFHHIV